MKLMTFALPINSFYWHSVNDKKEKEEGGFAGDHHIPNCDAV